MCKLQMYCHVQPRSAVELARTRSLSHTFTRAVTGLPARWLAFSRTRLAGAAKPFSFHSFPSCYFSNESICYVATEFCEDVLIVVEDVTTKQNSKECLIVAECNFRFQFLHAPGPSYLLPCKTSAKSRLYVAELLRLT